MLRPLWILFNLCAAVACGADNNLIGPSNNLLDQIDVDHLVARPTLAVPKTFACDCGCEQGALCTCPDCPANQKPTQLVSLVNGSRRDMPLYNWAQSGGNGSPKAPLVDRVFPAKNQQPLENSHVFEATRRPSLTQAEADAALLALNQPLRNAVKGAAKLPGAAAKGVKQVLRAPVMYRYGNCANGQCAPRRRR